MAENESEEQLKELLEYFHAEDHESSLVLAKRLLCNTPSLKMAWNVMGIAIAHQGDPGRSIPSFSKALQLDPLNFHLHNNIGNALKSSNSPKLAERAYRRSITFNPQFHLPYFNLGELKLNDDNAGVLHLEKCLLLHAGFSHAPLLLADKLIAEKRFEECTQWLNRSARHLIFSYEVQIRLISCLFELKDYDECHKRSLWLISITPGRQEAYLSLSLTREELGLSSNAILQRAALIAPESPQTNLMLARSDIDEGRFQAAKDLIKGILNQDPNNAAALSLIPFTMKMKSDDRSWLMAASGCASGPDVSDDDQIALLFSLGKYHDDIEEYDRAFHFYEQANGAALALEKDSRKEDVGQLYTEIIRSHGPEDITRPVKGHSRSQVPVLIVGMPRSGSSLIEQILASHPKVAGAGELPFWQDTLKKLNKDINHPQRLPLDEAKIITEKYLSILSGFDSERVVDKALINFVFLGYILALFPEAKIIHTHRDPIDTCLSIFFSNFGLENHPYSYSLTEIHDWYVQYHKLMTHWTSIIPSDRLLNVAYQDIVNDPDFWTRKALSFVGLPYDSRCANFFKTDRRVHTSSNWQVRQPIYHSSLNRWRNYEQHLAPLLDLSSRCKF